MKKLPQSPSFYLMVFTLALLLVFTHCSETANDGVSPKPPVASDDVLASLSDPSNILSSIIVSHGTSIQEAIDAAQSGQVIYIEPGKYNETISTEKAGIKLIGITGEKGEKVVVENISKSSDTEIINVYENENDSPLENIKAFFQPDDIELNNAFSANTDDLQQGRIRSGTNSFYCLFRKVKRTPLHGDVAHYEFEIPLGGGPFDVIRLHRVVREQRPYRPVKTKGQLIMVHGASQDFNDIFLSAGNETPDPTTSSPVYLASNNIDVWGIDLAWTLVPLETTDFNFMKDWGVQHDVNHTLAAISIVRLVRGLTGQHFGPINLLGFSYGVSIAYTAAGQETLRHRFLRNIKGIIPVDGGMKYASSDDASRINACTDGGNFKAAIDAGMYQTTLGVNIAPIGQLASMGPDDPSPIPVFAGLTNFQVAMVVGTSPATNPPAPFWHFVGGDFNSLLYTDESRWIKLISDLAPYQPQRTGYEYRVCLCDEEESYLDDHLSEIAVPILYLGAEGGLGSLGEYTALLTASTDKTIHTVSKQTSDNRAIDYGHADLWMAEQASTDVWQQLQQWLVNHN